MGNYLEIWKPPPLKEKYRFNKKIENYCWLFQIKNKILNFILVSINFSHKSLFSEN